MTSLVHDKFHREVEAVRNHGADTGESSGPVGRHRVLRGGCWNNNDRANLLSSNRNHNQPGNRNNNNGLPPLRSGIEGHLAELWLELAAEKTPLMSTSAGVPFCGFVFHPGLRPRVLGATKRRFEQRRAHLARARDFSALSHAVMSWYAFSREGSTLGLRRAYASSRRV